MGRALSVLTLLALAGCTLGPNYHGPAQIAPRGEQASSFVRASDTALSARPGVTAWWRVLNDPLLDMLEERALAANPGLDVARARLRQARASLREQKAGELPKTDATAMYAHVHLPGLNLDQSSSGQQGGGDTTDLNLYNLGFDASWEVDLFGGQRRVVEAAQATADAAQAGIADAQVSLTAEVAEAYVNLRDRQQRIALAERSIQSQSEMITLTRQRLDRGTASRLDLIRLQNGLDSTRASATPLRAERDAYLDQLATLTGGEPGAVDTLVGASGALPVPPGEVAVGDPAELLRNRPDICQAERALAAQTAKIGQAEAARFPRVSFMGLIGLGGTKLSDVTDTGSLTALIAPQISWSFLDFGRNKARVEQAEGARDEAEAQYRATVLSALRDAEDSLSRFGYRRQTLASLAQAKAQADEAEALADQRYRAGTTTMIDLLDTRRQQIEAEQALSQGEAGLTGDFVAIQKALGLGWSKPGPT
jgi:NodT family efflux transporter outer membrane factor (OMF) lipoprotein